MTPPDDCPNCGQVLYPMARLRPTPSFRLVAKLLLLFGILATVALYWVGIVYGSSYARLPGTDLVPIGILALVLFPVAVLPALVCAFIAYRLAKHLTLRCRKCGWQATFECRRTHGTGGERD